MDGNGRWARQRGLPRVEGHRAGIRAVRETRRGGRPARARGAHPLRLLDRELEAPALGGPDADGPAAGVPAARARPAGRQQHPLPPDRPLERARPGHPGRPGARRRGDQPRHRPASSRSPSTTPGAPSSSTPAGPPLARAGARRRCDPEAIDEAWVAAHLATAGSPDPDLLIRTSGELRISNFLLWQIAYTELHFTPVLWPDFTTRRPDPGGRRLRRPRAALRRRARARRPAPADEDEA